ncbi:Ig-like domain-containing protein [Bacteroides sp.]|uniref:Ig-like domain-containing protein n=2 Tax=Bacteroides TaxID=816 RepID=UPI00131416DB|nr:Ig-like domain-containing protein [Bacteroides sp.]
MKKGMIEDMKKLKRYSTVIKSYSYMKAFRLLATSLLVALSMGFTSCGEDELDRMPSTSLDEGTLFDKTDKLFSEYIKDYSNIKCRYGLQGESSVLLSGLKDNHLWFSEYDAVSKQLKSEWIDIEKTDTIQQLYKGYGEYETLYVKYVAPLYYKEISTGNIVTFNIGGRFQTIFTSNHKAKRTQLQYDNSKNGIAHNWYKESVFIADCCYSHEGDTIYIAKSRPSFDENGNLAGVTLVSYEEGIELSGRYINRRSFKEGKSVWSTYIAPPFDVPSDAKRNYTLLGNTTNIWEYKCEVTFYDGTKRDFTFKINIDNGKIVTDEIKVTGISINENTVNLKQGETFQLTATVQPDNATNNKVIWSSSNETVASISQEGLVTANSAGETNITVTTEDGNFSTTAIVTVTSNEDEDKATLARLEGTWDMLKCYGWEYNDQNIKENWEENVVGEYIFFEDEDGNGGYNDGYKTYYFASSVEGNKLILRNSEWLDGKTSIIITKLTETELHLKAIDSVSEENYEMKRR